MAHRINLVPRSERPRTRTDFGLLAMVGLFIIVIFALGFGYYVLSNVLDDRKQELADLESQTAALEQQVAALRQYEVLAARTQSVETVVQGVYSSRTLLSGVLDAVSLVVPDNVWFQNLKLTALDPKSNSGKPSDPASARALVANDNRISIEGQTYSFEDVSRLVVRLQLIPSLSGVELTSASQANEGGDSALEIKGFAIGASVVNEQPATALPLTEVEVQAQ
jgi:Tfp pilus assembly protein PilN